MRRPTWVFTGLPLLTSRSNPPVSDGPCEAYPCTVTTLCWDHAPGVIRPPLCSQDIVRLRRTLEQCMRGISEAPPPGERNPVPAENRLIRPPRLTIREETGHPPSVAEACSTGSAATGSPRRRPGIDGVHRMDSFHIQEAVLRARAFAVAQGPITAYTRFTGDAS